MKFIKPIWRVYMNKDRRITIISIMIWAVCVIALIGYYKVIKPNGDKNENKRLKICLAR